MDETALTQEAIDNGVPSANGKTVGLFAKAASHPVLTGGALLAGAGLAYAAAKAIKVATGDSTAAGHVHVETSIAIDRSPAELYSFWREFKNLPLFMKNLDSVSDLRSGVTHWVAKGPDRSLIEWDAEIYIEKENELISWRSLEDADVVNAGTVRFQTAPAGHGTYVRLTLNYNAPPGAPGANIAQLPGADPHQQIKEDLRRLKQIMEAGEIATVDGQTSGRAAEATPLQSNRLDKMASELMTKGALNESSLLEREA